MRRAMWITIAAAAVVAVIVVAAFLAGRNSGPQAASPRTSTPATPSIAPSAATSADTLGAAPTGCLGGTARTDATVLAAQKQAPHTAYGAVEVAATIFRWAIRSPEPSATDVHGIAPIFTAAKRSAAQQQLIADYRANPNPSGGTVPNGHDFYLTTANGQWLIAGGATSDRAAVDVQAFFVIDSAVSPTKSLTETFNMAWQEGGWHLDGLANGDAARLAAGGTQFTAGC